MAKNCSCTVRPCDGCSPTSTKPVEDDSFAAFLGYE
jgi:hypothetical protein